MSTISGALQIARMRQDGAGEEPGDSARDSSSHIEMSFAGGAPDHQRAQLQEARPRRDGRRSISAPDLGTAAGKEILIEDEERLDRPDLAESHPL